MTQIPEKRHGHQELGELRRRNAFEARPPIQEIKALALHPIFIGLGYVLCLAGAGLILGKIYIPGLSCAGLGLLGALFIFWKKPRSRHHAAFMAIISLLVFVFGSVYYLDQFEQPNNDPQGPIRY